MTTEQNTITSDTSEKGPVEETFTPNEDVEEIVAKPIVNYEIQYSWTSPIEKIDTTKESIVLPTVGAQELEQRLSPYTGLFSDSASDSYKNYGALIQRSVGYSPVKNVFSSTAGKDNSTFRQSVSSRVGELMGGEVKVRYAQGVKLQGPAAIQRIRQSLGLGSPINIPLWHSGFWIRIKSPVESELLELYRVINLSKVDLGRRTYGMVFSNSSSYVAAAIVNFLKEHLQDTSVAFPDGVDPFDHILVTDLYTLVWGLASSIWPNGFQYARICIAKPDACKHIVKEKINLTKILWVDTNQLTAAQVTQMTERDPRKMSVDSLKKYQSDFLNSQDIEVKFTDELNMTLRVPTINEFINSGYRWVNSIETDYPRSLFADEQERSAYIDKQALASTMREYGHFIKNITALSEVYDDQETIEGALSEISADTTLREMFSTKIGKFIDESTIALVGIPTFTCPKCGKNQSVSKETKHHPGIIPLDPVTIFFTLLAQKNKLITER